MTAREMIRGFGSWDRLGAPEPSLLPYLTLHCAVDDLPRVAYLARLFAEDPGRGCPLPVLAEAVAAEIAARADEVVDPFPLALELPLLGSVLKFSSQPEDARPELMARVAVARGDAGRARAAIDAARWDDAVRTAVAALPLVGDSSDVLDFILSKAPWVPIDAMAALAEMADEGQRRRLVYGWLRVPGPPETVVAGLAALLPHLQNPLREAAAAAALAQLGSAQVPPWRMAILVRRLRTTAVGAMSPVLAEVVAGLDEPWRAHLSSAGSAELRGLPSKEVLESHPCDRALKATEPPNVHDVAEALHAMLDWWGGAPPPTAPPTIAEPSATYSVGNGGGDGGNDHDFVDSGFTMRNGDAHDEDSQGAASAGLDGSVAGTSSKDGQEERTVPVEDPPRTAYARMDCDNKVVVGQEFALVVGLAATSSSGVVGSELRRPESSVGNYDLWIHVTAEGFRLHDGETWRRGIPVTAQMPYPATTFRLTPEPTEEDVTPAAIKATFTVDGQVIGWAVRPVVVIAEGSDPDEIASPAEPGLDIGVTTAGAGADLFMTFEYSRDKRRLLLKLETGFGDIDVPDDAIKVEIGSDAGTYAQNVINAADLHEGTPGGYYDLRGVSRDLAIRIKSHDFWEIFAEVVKRCRDQGRRPAVLILSEDPYVPWELMALDEVEDVRFDPDGEAFLGAQVDVGRWLLDRPKPPFPPTMSKLVGAMAMIWSDYAAVPTPNLDAAKLEAEAITAAPYLAANIAATETNMFAALEGTPPADALHFAVHGRYDPKSVDHGLLLGDEKVVSPSQVRGAGVAGSPFVFLNACQVGTGDQTLGGYSGMAAAFLRAGACAVVAPLWSVKDVVAKDIAIHFYQQVFEGKSPAAVLREERAKFTKAATSSTYLAYQFFGHPKMKLSRR